MDAIDTPNSTYGVVDCFFYCSKIFDEVNEELDKLRKNMKLSKEVELLLINESKKPEWDNDHTGLIYFTELAENAKLNYRMRVIYPEETNRYVSEEAVHISRYLYNSNLYEENEKFRFEIVFEENGKYLVRDNE